VLDPTQPRDRAGRRRKRFLTPAEKYQAFVQVLCGEMSVAQCDNGPQMRAGTTREFLAMCSIVAHFGRPGTPTDQAWIETLFGHGKGEWPHLEKITHPTVLAAELEIVRAGGWRWAWLAMSTPRWRISTSPASTMTSTTSPASHRAAR
jgi:hypothetical protein